MRGSKFGDEYLHIVFADFVIGSMLLRSTLTLQICLQRRVYKMDDRNRLIGQL
jgi:hypothetical protein